MTKLITWARKGGYEVSTKGDTRFSAMVAKMPDGRTIEQWYQCDIKGHDIGGTNWRAGKGKPPKFGFTVEEQYQLYKSLWQLWAIHNVSLMFALKGQAEKHFNKLSDCFASTDINQARALSEILNEWFLDEE